MNADPQAKFSPPKKRLSPMLILSAAVAGVGGAHIGNIVGLFPPYPENGLAVLSAAILTSTTAVWLALAIIAATVWNSVANQSPKEGLFTDARWHVARLLHGDRLELLGWVVIGFFVLPLIWATHGIVRMAILAAVALLSRMSLLLLDYGPFGRAGALAAWFMLGIVMSPAVTGEAPGIHLTCKESASITFHSGETMACSTVRQLRLYDDILLIRNDTTARFAWPSEVVADTVRAATNDWAIMMFDE